MRRTKVAIGVAAVLAALVLLTACGGGGDGSTSTGPTADGGQEATGGKEASGTPIKISVLSVVNNPEYSFPGVFAGAEVAAEHINEEGGVGPEGQPVEVVSCDYQLDPNKANICARDAVSSGVVADVASVDGFTATTTPILASAKIARIAAPLFSPADLTAPDTYPISSGGMGIIRGAGPAIASMGLKKIALAVPDPGTPENPEIVEAGVKAAGATLVGEVKVPAAGTSDYAPYAKQLQELGAEAIFSYLGSPFFQLVETFNQLGGEAVWFEAGNSDSKQIEAAGNAADGVFTISYLPPFTETKLPAVAEWVEQMDAAGEAGLDGADQLTSQTFNAWLGVYALQALLANAEGPVTNETVNELLKSSSSVNIKDLINWTPTAKGPPDYTNITNEDLWVSEIHGTELQLTDESPISLFK